MRGRRARGQGKRSRTRRLFIPGPGCPWNPAPGSCRSLRADRDKILRLIAAQGTDPRVDVGLEIDREAAHLDERRPVAFVPPVAERRLRPSQLQRGLSRGQVGCPFHPPSLMLLRWLTRVGGNLRLRGGSCEGAAATLGG